MARNGLPPIITNQEAFYLDPESALPEGERPQLAASEYGTEILSYQLVRAAFRDKRLKPRDLRYFEQLGASEIILEFIREGNLNFMAPDKHDRIRGIMVKAFTPGRIEAYRPEMRRIADELIDGFIQAGKADLVDNFAHNYPIAVIARFMGVPAADVPSFAHATVQLRMLGQIPFAPGMPVLEGALTFLYTYVERLVDERRSQAVGDDFVGALLALQEAGEKLSHKELIWGLVFLMLGGHDTTRFTLAGCLYSIIDAGLWDMLACEPGQIPAAIAESMRLRPGTPRQMRLVSEPVELAGHDFQSGDVISLNLLAAGRDPQSFVEPETFRCPRQNPAYDIGFGFGRHVCLGQPLAKAEMEEAIAMLTRRLTDVAIDGACRVKPTGVIAGYDSLPVRFAIRGEEVPSH